MTKSSEADEQLNQVEGWIKLGPKEYQESLNKQRDSLTPPMLLFIGINLFFFFISNFEHSSRHGHYYPPMPRDEYLTKLPFHILISLIFSIGLYLYQRFSKKVEAPTLLCPTCDQIFTKSSEYTCPDCGNFLEDILKFKWIDSPTQTDAYYDKYARKNSNQLEKILEEYGLPSHLASRLNELLPNKKLAAIKYIRESTQFNLKEAKEFVDIVNPMIIKGIYNSGASNHIQDDRNTHKSDSDIESILKKYGIPIAVTGQLKELLPTKKIEAVKCIKHSTQIGLKEAKECVDTICLKYYKEEPSGCAGPTVRLLLFFLGCSSTATIFFY